MADAYRLLRRLANLAGESVEYGDWPELQALVEETHSVDERDAPELLDALRRELRGSVEYSDWPELIAAVEKAEAYLEHYWA